MPTAQAQIASSVSQALHALGCRPLRYVPDPHGRPAPVGKDTHIFAKIGDRYFETRGEQ